MKSEHVHLLVLALLVGCLPLRPPEPNPDGDGGCREACQNLEALGCEGSVGSPGEDDQYGTEDDFGCVEVCEEVQSSPGGDLNTGCVAEASSCRQADDCMADES